MVKEKKAVKKMEGEIEEKQTSPVSVGDDQSQREDTETGEKEASPKVRRKKSKRLVEEGRVNILATFNNTIITVSDASGGVIAWGSAGGSGFKGSKKSTPYAAGIATQKVIEKAKAHGLKRVVIFVKGVGSGRESAVRAFGTAGVDVDRIEDTTPIPHNGVRPRKARRV